MNKQQATEAVKASKGTPRIWFDMGECDGGYLKVSKRSLLALLQTADRSTTFEVIVNPLGVAYLAYQPATLTH